MTFRLRASVSSGAPLYRQVADQLWGSAASGVLRTGDAVPAAAALARDLVVHPSVVGRAYDLLRAEGLLARRDDGALVCVSRTTRDTAADLEARQRRDASAVQRALLPASVPQVRGLDLAAVTRPALGVGGDYFDFLDGGDGRLCVVCADVAGKGMAAALVMATLRAFVHSHLESAESLPALAATLNRRLYDSTAPSRFATCCLLRYDGASRAVDYVNAGHLPPVVRRTSGIVERFAVHGPALGILPGAYFQAGHVSLDPGDVVALYSDGVTDATSAAGDEFGEARLLDGIARHAHRGAPAIVEEILAAVDRFAAGVSQFDDITLVALRATEGRS